MNDESSAGWLNCKDDDAVTQVDVSEARAEQEGTVAVGNPGAARGNM